MAARAGTNTQFGCLLLLVPLVRASVGDDEDDANLFPASVDRVTRETTVDDAVAFYRAFDHVDVAVVGDPPTDADALDVRRGSDATPRPGAGGDPTGRDGALGRARRSRSR